MWSRPSGGLLAWAALLVCQLAGADDRPVLVVIIDDLGYRLEAGQRAAALPGKVNLAVLPQTPNGREVARLGLAAGKEILLHTPMSNSNGRPLGRGGLTESMSEAELKSTLARNIDSTPGVRGINNHMGSLLTARREPMTWVMEELAQRGMYYVDSRTTDETVAASVAEEYGVPNLSRKVFLDYLARQLPRVEYRGYRLALISEVLATRLAHSGPRQLTGSD